jgi:hypothetical protein
VVRGAPVAAVPSLALAGAAVALAACGSFEREDVVLDLRVLAMRASVPDQLVDVDLANPPQPSELLAQLVPSEMCALVADPALERRIRWSMTLCLLNSDQRCTSDAQVKLASGIADDPETAQAAPRMCATISPDGNLLGVLLEALDEADVYTALGGIEYGISLVVGAEGDDPALDQYAGKRVRVSPRIPAARTANANPSLQRLDGSIEGGAPVLLPPGRCVEQPAPLELRPGQTMRVTPVEADGAREVYVVPRLDGEQQTFTEALTYQWLASAGGFSSGSTGGPRDVAGNPAPLFTDYKAPPAKDLTGPTDVQLWVIQRDERLGAAWYEACVRVVP